VTWLLKLDSSHQCSFSTRSGHPSKNGKLHGGSPDPIQAFALMNTEFLCSNRTCVLLLSLALLGIAGTTNAQVVSEKRVVVNGVPHKYKLVDIKQNPVSKEAYYIYSWVKIARGDYVTGRNIIVTEHGNRIVLDKDEEVVGFAANKLLTIFPDYEDVSSKIRCSAISGSQRTLLSSKRIDGVGAELVNNGKNISITDQHEGGGGSSFDIYSQNLKRLTSYQPFQQGYAEIAQDSDERRTVVAASSRDSQKIVVLDNTGNKRKEATLSIPGLFQVGNVKLVGKYVLAYGHQWNEKTNEPVSKLICLDNQLKVAWSKDISLAYDWRGLAVFGLPALERIFFLASSVDGADDDLVCLNLTSGDLVWKRSLSALYKGEAKKTLAPVTKINIGLRPAAMEVNEEMRSVFLVLGNMVQDADNSNTFRYEASCLFVFDENGKTTKVLDYSASSKMVRIMSQRGSIKVIDNQNLLRYEAAIKK